MVNTVEAIFVIEMKYCFGIAAVLKNVSLSYQFVPALGVVVYLTVVDNNAMAMGHRLCTMGDIDDTQPPVAKANIAVDEQTTVVGSAVMQDVAHIDELLSPDKHA